MRLVGKLDQVHTRNFAINTLINLGEDVSDIDNPMVYLTEEYNEYVIVGDCFFALFNLKELDPDGTYLMTNDTSGVFHFDVSYYNGGCGLGEAIEQALKNMK
jgi:hypothetical protein